MQGIGFARQGGLGGSCPAHKKFYLINLFTQLRNKNSNIQGSDFPCHKELLLKERICSLWKGTQLN